MLVLHDLYVKFGAGLEVYLRQICSESHFNPEPEMTESVCMRRKGKSVKRKYMSKRQHSYNLHALPSPHAANLNKGRLKQNFFPSSTLHSCSSRRRTFRKNICIKCNLIIPSNMDSMDTFTHKSLITDPYRLTYSYYLSPNFPEHTKSSPDAPILLLLHGFPDDAHMWAGAIPILLQLGYPLLIPDLLGFGGSSKPTDPSRYNYKQQADSLAQILDVEGLSGSTLR